MLHRRRRCFKLADSWNVASIRLHASRNFGEGEALQLLLVGLGSARDLRAPLLAESTIWVSATPFVVTRYPKRRGAKRDRLEDYATPQAFARHLLRQNRTRRALTAIGRHLNTEAEGL